MSVNGLMANLGESHFQGLLYSVNQNVNLSFSEYVGQTCRRLFIASVQKKCFYSQLFKEGLLSFRIYSLSSCFSELPLLICLLVTWYFFMNHLTSLSAHPVRWRAVFSPVKRYQHQDSGPCPSKSEVFFTMTAGLSRTSLLFLSLSFQVSYLLIMMMFLLKIK